MNDDGATLNTILSQEIPNLLALVSLKLDNLSELWVFDNSPVASEFLDQIRRNQRLSSFFGRKGGGKSFLNLKLNKDTHPFELLKNLFQVVFL